MATPYYSRDGIDLYRGDCLEILPSFPSSSVPMIWTDPPFGHGNQQDDLQAARVRDDVFGARKKPTETISNDSGADFETALKGFLDQSSRILDRDCCCCCCMAGGGPNVTFARVSQWIDERLAFFMAVVWDKSARGNGMGWRYRRNYEFVMVAHRKGGTLRWADDDVAVPNIMRDLPPMDRLHPNQKPFCLVSRFIELHTKPNDVVLDPFAGSGTTLLAAWQLGRKAIGIEIEEKYVEIAARRLDNEISRGRLFEPEPAPMEQLTFKD